MNTKDETKSNKTISTSRQSLQIVSCLAHASTDCACRMGWGEECIRSRRSLGRDVPARIAKVRCGLMSALQQLNRGPGGDCCHCCASPRRGRAGVPSSGGPGAHVARAPLGGGEIDPSRGPVFLSVKMIWKMSESRI